MDVNANKELFHIRVISYITIHLLSCLLHESRRFIPD